MNMAFFIGQKNDSFLNHFLTLIMLVTLTLEDLLVFV